MKRSGVNVMIRLVTLVKPLIFVMILAIFMGLLGNLFASSITIFGGYALLQILGLPSKFELTSIFLLILIFAISRGFLRYAEQTCNHYIAFKLLALIRDKVFAALRVLCPAKLEGKDKGNLISIITSDIELLEVFYAHTISPIFIAIIFDFCIAGFIAKYNLSLGFLALLAYFTVGFILPFVTSKLSKENGNRQRDYSGALATYILDSLRGLPETLQFGLGETRSRELKEHTSNLLVFEKNNKVVSGVNMAVTDLIILIFDMIMLFLSFYLCGFEGSLICTLALMSSFGPNVSLSSLGSGLQQTFAAGNRVLDILDEKPQVNEIVGKDEITFNGAIVENITFSYEDINVLDNLSVDLPKNKIIGLIGKSGSGKSTLLKLLMRFWNVNQGEIRISNKSINDINTSNLRNMESYVTQNTHLFHDSILNNIKIAKLDASREEIEDACKKASVHDFIMSLPNGYDTEVSELGESLSGGEKQRLGLARAFLHNSPLMLLDEPTSNLDSLNEATILKALHRERKGKTIVLVSHRKSTMGIVDELYSVDNGRLS